MDVVGRSSLERDLCHFINGKLERNENTKLDHRAKRDQTTG